MSGKPVVYWDASAFIALLKGEESHGRDASGGGRIDAVRRRPRRHRAARGLHRPRGDTGHGTDHGARASTCPAGPAA